MKALITGASSGIGRDIARELNKKGYELILVARDIDKLKELKNEFEVNSKFDSEADKNNNDSANKRDSSERIEIVSMDLSYEGNCKQLYNMYPEIDLLINNAGFGTCGNFTNTDFEKELRMIRTNITAYHILTKLYLQNMVKKDKGQILNVASIAGFMPGPLMATYYATKAYVVRLSESIREELKKQKSNVKISILCPGPVDTNFNKVADVEFSAKGLSSEFVARYTVKKLEKNKFYIIPGFSIKCVKLFSKITPTVVLSKISYKMQRRKIS